MKKLLLTLSMLAILFCLCACGGTVQDETTQSTEEKEPKISMEEAERLLYDKGRDVLSVAFPSEYYTIKKFVFTDVEYKDDKWHFTGYYKISFLGKDDTDEGFSGTVCGITGNAVFEFGEEPHYPS